VKRDLVIGTAGHIDHGKTALVRALTGVDTDRLPAEKQRGITIDLGFAALDLGDVQLALVDVPGHERFIRNMLAGATGLDLALLVVAADDSVMPQTREHLEILRLLGLAGGVVALTKCDLSDPSWLALVEEDVRALIVGSFLEGAPIVRTSARSGDGLDDLRAALHALGRSAPPRDDPGLFRLAIDRSFTIAGHGTVVTGTVASGSVAVGDDLAWLPEGRPVRVRSLQRHDRPADRIGRGARAAINLVGVHHAEIRRGQELAAPGYLEPTRVLSVEVRTSGDAPRPIRHRHRYRLHLGTAEVSATLSLLETNELRAGGVSLGQVFVSEPVVAVSGQPFVLREESPAATLGGGRVLAPSARRLRRRDRPEIARLARLRSVDPNERAAAAMAGAGFSLHPWTDRDLCREAGLSVSEASSATAALAASGNLIALPIGPRRTVRVLAEVAEALEDRVMRALARLHAARPRQSAIPRSHVAAELPDLASDALVAALLARLEARGRIVSDRRTVALRGYEPKLSQGERRLKNELAEALRAGGFSPPEVPDLAAAAPGKAAVVPELLALLRDEESAVEISPRLYLDFEAAAELRRRVLGKLAGGDSMTMAVLRDLLGTSRKYAVPIGEYLDRTGITLRDGDSRRLGPNAIAAEVASA
jgi:selenocysteine-specific elongation factor